MFTNKTKKFITLLMLLAMALFIQPAWTRGGGGGGHGGGGFRGGGGGFHGSAGVGGGGLRGESFRGGEGMSHFSGGFRGNVGGFNRGFSNNGTANRSFIAGRPSRSFHSFTSSTGFPGFDGRDMPTTGFNSKTTFRSPRSGSFDNGKSSRGFSGIEGRFGGSHFGGHGFNRDKGHFFNHHDFDDHHGHHHHSNFFFNPFFDDFFFTGGFFYNPFFYGYGYGYPYYGYDYYYPYGYDYGAYPNNYNTYNYYYTNPETAVPNYSPDFYNQIQGDGQSQPTKVDAYFNEGVKAFKSGDYLSAAVKLDNAVKLMPQDKVLPFAYAQAVFAGGKYPEAAAAVRDAVAKVNPETEGIFYPRGLYSNDAEINRQITNLNEAAMAHPENMDLQLLLGYNWLGMGQLDKAKAALETAGNDPVNGPTAKALLKLVDKLQTSQKETPATQTPAPATVTPKTETPNVETVPPETPPAEAPQVDTSAAEEPIA